MTTSNCGTCEYKRFNNDPKLHCYMFKTAPVGICAQHCVSRYILDDPNMVSLSVDATVAEDQAQLPYTPPISHVVIPVVSRINYADTRLFFKKTTYTKGSPLDDALQKNKKGAEKLYDLTTANFDALYGKEARLWFENWRQV
jgi:hypothetical protein